jgi:DNA-binding NtrC family response regulator
MDILRKLAEEFQIRPAQVENTVKLIDEGNTIPFIARYRKEAHGTLDDTQLRTLDERLRYLRALEERRSVILASIEEQGKLTPELKKQIEDVQGGIAAQPSQQLSTAISPLPTTLPAITPQLSPLTEDAEAEEYIEPSPELENLNVNDWSRQALEKALQRNGGNRKKAALELGISDRTLYRRLKQYGLDK